MYEHGVSFEGRFGDNVSGKMNAVIGKFVHRFTPLFFKFKTTLLLQLNIWFVNSKLNKTFFFFFTKINLVKISTVC